MQSHKNKNKSWHLLLNSARLKMPTSNSPDLYPRSNKSHLTSRNLTRRKTARARIRTTRRNPSVLTLASGLGRTMLLHKGILKRRNSKALLTFGVQPIRSGVLIPINSVVNEFDSKRKQQRVETVVQTMPIKPTMPRTQTHLPLSCQTCKTKNDCSAVFTRSHSDLLHSKCQSSL